MSRAARKSLRIGIEPLWKCCPRCDMQMRRDYVNRRTVFFPDRTISLRLQIMRCQNVQCSRYKRPHRPEVEWHYALPGTKFGLDTCAAIFAAHLDGKSNLAIHRAISELGLRSARRSVGNVVRRYVELFATAASPWSAEVNRKLKVERKAFLDILLACDENTRMYCLVRECFSNSILATSSIAKKRAVNELRSLFQSVIDRLPVPVVKICCSGPGTLIDVAEKMWPETSIRQTNPDGIVGKRQLDPRHRRRSS